MSRERKTAIIKGLAIPHEFISPEEVLTEYLKRFRNSDIVKLALAEGYARSDKVDIDAEAFRGFLEDCLIMINDDGIYLTRFYIGYILENLSDCNTLEIDFDNYYTSVPLILETSPISMNVNEVRKRMIADFIEQIEEICNEFDTYDDYYVHENTHLVQWLE